MPADSTEVAYIYSLVDPCTREVRYIGRSRSPTRRFRTHIREARRGSDRPKYRWMRSVLQSGRTPELVLLRCVPSSEAKHIESMEIMRAGCLGMDLLNVDGNWYRPSNRQRTGSPSDSLSPERARRIEEDILERIASHRA